MSVISLSSEDDDDVITFNGLEEVGGEEKREVTVSRDNQGYQFKEYDLHGNQGNVEEEETDPFAVHSLKADEEFILPDLEAATFVEVDLRKILGQQDLEVSRNEERSPVNEDLLPVSESDAEPVSGISDDISLSESKKNISKMQFLATQLAQAMENHLNVQFSADSSSTNHSHLATEQKCLNEEVVNINNGRNSAETASKGHDIQKSDEMQPNTKDGNMKFVQKKRGRKKGWRKNALTKETSVTIPDLEVTRDKNVIESSQIENALLSLNGENLEMKTARKRGRKKGWRKSSGSLTDITEEERPTSNSTVKNTTCPVSNAARGPAIRRGLKKGLKKMNKNPGTDHKQQIKVSHQVDLENCELYSYNKEQQEEVHMTESNLEGVGHAENPSLLSNNIKKMSEKYKSGWKKRLLEREGIINNVNVHVNIQLPKKSRKHSFNDSGIPKRIKSSSKKYSTVNHGKSPVIKNKRPSTLESEMANKMTNFITIESILRGDKNSTSLAESSNESSSVIVPTKELYKADLVNKLHSKDLVVSNSLSTFGDKCISNTSSTVEIDGEESGNMVNHNKSSPLEQLNSKIHLNVLHKITSNTKSSESDRICKGDLFRFLHYENRELINEHVNVKVPIAPSLEMDFKNIACPRNNYAKSYSIVYDDKGELKCMEMGDILHLLLNEFVNLKIRLDTTSKLSCDKLKREEISSALKYYKESFTQYKGKFQNLFSAIYEKIFNNQVIAHNFQEYRRAMLLTWFNKLYIRVMSFSSDFNESLEDMKTYIINGLLSNVLIQYPFVKKVFATGKRQFEKETNIVMAFMEDCLKEDMNADPSTADISSKVNDPKVMENALKETERNLPVNGNFQLSQDEEMESLNMGISTNENSIELNQLASNKQTPSAVNLPQTQCSKTFSVNYDFSRSIGSKLAQAGGKFAGNAVSNKCPPSSNYEKRNNYPDGTVNPQYPRPTVICDPINSSSSSRGVMSKIGQQANALGELGNQQNADNIRQIGSNIGGSNETQLRSDSSVSSRNDNASVLQEDSNRLPLSVTHRLIEPSSWRQNVHPGYSNNGFTHHPLTHVSPYSQQSRMENAFGTMNSAQRISVNKDGRVRQNNANRGYRPRQPAKTNPTTAQDAIAQHTRPAAMVHHAPNNVHVGNRLRLQGDGPATSGNQDSGTYHPNTTYQNQYQSRYTAVPRPQDRHSFSGQNLNSTRTNPTPAQGPATERTNILYNRLNGNETYMRHNLRRLYSSQQYQRYMMWQKYGPTAGYATDQMISQRHPSMNNSAATLPSAINHHSSRLPMESSTKEFLPNLPEANFKGASSLPSPLWRSSLQDSNK